MPLTRIELVLPASEASVLSVKLQRQTGESVCARKELNFYCEFRKLVSYPLNDGRIILLVFLLVHVRMR